MIEMCRTNLQVHMNIYAGCHIAPSPPQKSFPQQATMGSKSSVAEVGKDVSCSTILCSLFLMIRIGCTSIFQGIGQFCKLEGDHCMLRGLHDRSE